ncbi:MAG: sigma-54 dependent transcriptional regulator [Acidobacteriota bacterium]|nr:sigma-54 dependent transcriptional regulator [Acidobacteriota bacterium]MDQ7088503.1 sigma-54 dependent transcriptional regulator [Acidobacteriota bacterium]
MTATRKSKTRFVSLLVCGVDRRRAAAWAERLAPVFDEMPETLPPEELAARLGRSKAVGAVVFVPAGGGGALIEAVRAARDACRGADPALPLAVVSEGLEPADLVGLFRLEVQELLHPDDPEPVTGRLRAFVERRASRSQGLLFGSGKNVPRLLGRSTPMQDVARLVEKVAPSDATALILGESGTGKELVARALHVLSPRRRGPFVAINCAAIPETLLENELFGHEKGAYTGANATAIGKVEAAEKGTLFLDEIGEMPIQLQSKILRLLQDRTYDRIGGTRTRKADVRIVAATNRELLGEVTAKRFREDLYYRLSVVPIPLPSLRERPEDIPLLVNFILDRLAEKLGRPGLRVSPPAMERLVAYRWPGNVRELENELERAAVLAQGDEIQPADLELRARVEDPDLLALSRLVSLDGTLDETVRQAAAAAEKMRISHALGRHGGDLAAAAAELGLEVDELERRKA